jgi:magnesium chelatase family protein
MYARAHSATPRGVEALLVTVEVDRIYAQLPSLTIVGLPDTAVREAKERVSAALRRVGHRPGSANTIINLAPADERKHGASLDLPMAIGLLASVGLIASDALASRLLIGELSLDGKLLGVRGVLPIALAAQAAGFAELILPADNAAEGAVVEGISVVGAPTLGDVVRHLRGASTIVPTKPARSCHQPAPPAPDLAEVIGQETARRALEIAAAGGHHLLMLGPPGAGKSMLARRLPGILPPPSVAEAIETTCVYSVSARVPRPTGLMAQRPFRAPHHTVSAAGLIGGGSEPQPGEVSLAHGGVLFLDELTEFRRDVLESLRQPLEDGRVTVARAQASLTFPSRFQLVAAANPCPCGWLGSEQRPCTCTPVMVQRYRSRLSGPLLDRFDLQIAVPAVPWQQLGESRHGEPSATVAGRVAAARSAQSGRRARTNARCNAELAPTALQDVARPGADGVKLLEQAARTLGLSARGYHRILRAARTIADLDGSEEIASHHLAEAVSYRMLDRDQARAASA